jgi:hypothetical protein
VPRLADGLQVGVVIGAAFSLGQDVVDLGAHVHDAVGLARLADAGITPHHTLACLHPLRAVAALVPAAAPLVSKAVGHYLPPAAIPRYFSAIPGP